MKMDDPQWEGFDPLDLPSPAFVVNRGLLEANLKVLSSVSQASGAKILLALKGFAFWQEAQLISQYLGGTTASGLHELILGRQEFGKEATVYSPAYTPGEFDQILELADHIIFNTPGQLNLYRSRALEHPRKPKLGLRVNPGYSEVETEIYNPCAPFSRLGTPLKEFDPSQLEGISGLHFHTLCEQDSPTLERTLEHVEKNFGLFLKEHCQWVNFGGGHHITREDYNRELLVSLIQNFRSRYPLEVYLEPGEAIGLGTGILVAQVLEVFRNGMPLAILDTSATCHMPDVLEMPYRAEIHGADLPGKKAFTYRLGGQTCLAGDVIGDYSFDQPLEVGDRLLFLDMGHYTMVKTTTFNGINLPAIASYDPAKKETKVLRQFGYEDYKLRLG